MVFEDSAQSDSSGSRYLGEGFRQEPDFREATAPTVPVVPVVPGQVVTLPAENTVTVAKRGAPPNLEFVFDDPEDGEPGRDRMLVHGLWELVLALAVAGVGYLLYRSDTTLFSTDGLRSLLLDITMLGAAGMAMALSLRAAVPNLAVGAVAVAAALYFTEHANGGVLQPLLLVIGLAAVAGVVQGVVVAGLHVPGWAASLGVAAVLFGWAGTRPGGELKTFDPTPHAYWWLGGLAAVSVVAGLVGLVPPVRRIVSRFRPVGDPAKRRGMPGAVVAFVAIVVSSMLAAVAGVLGLGLSQTAPAPSDGFVLTALALGVALLGGTSAYGRRGGIFGTLLAAGLLTVGEQYAAHTHRNWSAGAFAAAAIAIGLGVTRLVERFGRPALPQSEDSEEDWAPRIHASTTTTTNGWATVKPPAPSTVGGIWAGDDSWGTTSR
jgi:ribose/xylose/arabinose/galactoside ABC-type transport system permease subunit